MEKNIYKIILLPKTAKRKDLSKKKVKRRKPRQKKSGNIANPSYYTVTKSESEEDSPRKIRLGITDGGGHSATRVLFSLRLVEMTKEDRELMRKGFSTL